MADPDALFMMGAAFDEELQDEIRVTVIATGFGTVSNPAPGKEDKPDCVPEGITPAPLEPLAEEPEKPETDPFDDIFKIFNKK